MSPDTITDIAKTVRQRIQRVKRKPTEEAYDLFGKVLLDQPDLKCWCALAAVALARELAVVHGLSNLRLVEGTYKGVDHAWTELLSPPMWLDISASQFNIKSPVYTPAFASRAYQVERLCPYEAWEKNSRILFVGWEEQHPNKRKVDLILNYE